RARTRRDVGDGLGTRLRETYRRELRVERRQLGFRDPAIEQVLRHRRAQGVRRIAARDVAEHAALRRRVVAERQRHGRDGVARLPLLLDVRLVPGLETLRVRPRTERRARLERRPVRLAQAREKRRPARIGPELLALLEHEATKLLDAEL